MNEKPKKACFVIAPMGDEDSLIRKRSNQVFDHIIAPAVETLGYTPDRADRLMEPGMISSQILQHVIEDDLVVADLTGPNANVFYELAVRHLFRKPFVQLIQKGERIPFDVAVMRTIHFDLADPDSVARARTDIERQVRLLETDPSKIETPISTVLNLEELRRSDDPNRQFQADVLSILIDIRARLSLVDVKLGTLDATSDTTSLPTPIVQALLRVFQPTRAAGGGPLPNPFVEALDNMQRKHDEKRSLKLDEVARKPKGST